MGDLPGIGIALFVGVLLGLFFFGGLWWTVQKGIASNWAALWFIGSLLLRTTTIIVAFYFVSQHHWPRFAACMVGFLLARFVTVKWLGLHTAMTLSEPTALAAGARQEHPMPRKPEKSTANAGDLQVEETHHEA